MTRSAPLAAAALLATSCTGPPSSTVDLERRIVAFQAAVEKGDAETVGQLLAEDPGLGRMSGGGGTESPIRMAVGKNHAAVVAKLFEAAPDLAERDEAGHTLLHRAASVDSRDAAELLIGKGAVVDAVDGEGATPLVFAVSASSRAMVFLLLESGARLDRRDKEGRVPLHHVHPTGIETTALLCASGADAAARDAKGRTARDVVAERLVTYTLSEDARHWADANLALLAPEACAALSARKVPPAGRLAATGVLAKELVCEAGRALSCRNAGVDFEHGKHIAQDLPRAASLYARACALGDVTGCAYEGSAHEKGFAGRRDLAQARRLYEGACEKDDAWACGSLGGLYYHGRGVKEDDAKAAALFRKACDGGSVWSCGQLGHATERGNGVPQDLAAAARLYEGACEKENAYSCWRLSELLKDGQGLPRDAARAATLAGKACAGGEERACAPGAKAARSD